VQSDNATEPYATQFEMVGMYDSVIVSTSTSALPPSCAASQWYQNLRGEPSHGP
jgi:hypothetical protein